METTFKEVMGNYPTGVTIATMIDENGEPQGLTVNSFTSVSIDPLLIQWSIDKKVSSYDAFIKTDTFAINILAADQIDLCMLFTKKNINRFEHCNWEKSKYNVPVLSDVAGVIQCKTYKTVEAGDHMIIIGEVVDIYNGDKEPLLYHKRNIGQIPESFYK